MKRFLLLLLLAAPAAALNTAVDQDLVNGPLAVSTSYSYNFGRNQTDVLAAQINLSSGTPATKTFHDSAATPGSSVIQLPSHGYATGLAVLYTSTQTLGGLTSQTTYYAIANTVDSIKLATSSAQATAGNGIVITSTHTDNTFTYTLTPLALSGSLSAKWQVSEDGVNWIDSSVSSITISSPYTAQHAVWDFGTWNHKYLRVPVSGPTTGQVNVQVILFGKRNVRP